MPLYTIRIAVTIWAKKTKESDAPLVCMGRNQDPEEALVDAHGTGGPLRNSPAAPEKAKRTITAWPSKPTGSPGGAVERSPRANAEDGETRV